MARKLEGKEFEIQYADHYLFTVYMPPKEAQNFIFIKDKVDGKDGCITTYELANFIDGNLYRDIEPDKNWNNLSDIEKDLVRQGEQVALKSISKIISLFEKVTDKITRENEGKFPTTFRPFPFTRYSDPTLMSDLISIHDDLKIKNINSLK